MAVQEQIWLRHTIIVQPFAYQRPLLCISHQVPAQKDLNQVTASMQYQGGADVQPNHMGPDPFFLTYAKGQLKIDDVFVLTRYWL